MEKSIEWFEITIKNFEEFCTKFLTREQAQQSEHKKRFSSNS